MRTLLTYLIVLGVLIALFALLLPIIGILLLLMAALIGFWLAAPFLARLPWFRNWIRVEERGPFRTVRFGSARFTGFSGAGRPPGERPGAGRIDQGDVIDVEPRVIQVDDGEERPQEQRPSRPE